MANKTTASKVENPFYDKQPELRVQKISKGLREYFECVEARFAQDWKLGHKGFVLSNAGNAILISFLEKIVRREVIGGKAALNKLDYIKYLVPLQKLFEERYSKPDEIRKLQGRITSELGRHQFLSSLVSYVSREIKDPQFAEGFSESSSSDDVTELEGKLKEVIRLVLSKGAGKDWFKERVEVIDLSMYKRALSRLEKNALADPDKAYLQLTLGECISLILTYTDLFEGVLWKCANGFDNRLAFETALKHIGKIRATQLDHTTGVDLRPYDWELFDIYMRKVDTCLDSVLGKNAVS